MHAFKPSHLRVILVLSCLLLGVSTAHAERRTSLAGNELILDQDDVFVYPQTLGNYGSRLTLDFGGAPNQGDGTFVYAGEGWNVGVGVWRGDLFQTGRNPGSEVAALGDTTLPTLPGVTSPGGSLPGFAPYDAAPMVSVFDIMFSTGNFGLRLGFGAGSQVQDTDAGETGTRQNVVSLGVGYSLGLGEWATDLGLRAVGTFGNENTQAGQTVSTGSLYALEARARAIKPVSTYVKAGLLGELEVGSQSLDFETPGNEFEQTGTRFRGRVGGGLVWDIASRASLSTYVITQIDSVSGDANTQLGDGDYSSLTWTTLGVFTAAEVKATEWLYVRAGMNYLPSVFEQEFGEDVGDLTQTGNIENFNWRAGLGFDFDEFRVDGTLGGSALTQGLGLFGGGNTFGIVSLSVYPERIIANVENPPAPTVVEAPPAPAPVIVRPDPVPQPPVVVEPPVVEEPTEPVEETSDLP